MSTEELASELRRLSGSRIFYRRGPRSVLDEAAARLESLESALREARINIAERYGAGSKNNIDADLLAQIDAALNPDAPGNRKTQETRKEP